MELPPLFNYSNLVVENADLLQRVDRLPAFAHGLLQAGSQFLIRAQGHHLGHLTGRISLQDLVHQQSDVLADAGDGALGLLGGSFGGIAHNALGSAEAFHSVVALDLSPGVGTAIGIASGVIVAGQHQTVRLRINSGLHIQHLGEQQQAHRGLRLIGVDKLRGNAVIMVGLCVEELTDNTVPVYQSHESGQLETLEELLNGGLDHPVMAMVVDQNDLAKAIVPQAQHGVDQHFLNSVLGNDDRAGHTGQAAGSDATVLITGDTGTGKEVVAREIYSKSNRSDKPYVRINCSAIPESLFESELFGYEKGAFTGALNTRKIGLLEMADGGTVLLDEIEDLPLAMQAKLLRALQEREIRRIGGSEVVKINIRLIATTNKDLLKMVEEGTFRRDFYYRLNVISISLPLLKERRQDIVALAGTFLSRFNEKYKKNKFFELEALARLESYEWPGNVRDLEHTIERLVVIGDQMEITADDVELAIHGERVSPVKEVGNLQDMLDAYERTILENAVKKYGSSRKIAEALGISQPTVLRKLKRLHIG